MCQACDYERLLASAGLKVTAQRRLVLEALGREEKPASAAEVLERASIQGSLDRVTVYRVLEALLRAGLVRRLRTSDRPWRYHLTVAPRHLPHPHFHCSRCGRVACLPAEAVRLDLVGLAHWAGLVQELEVRLEGLCPECLGRDPGPGWR